MANSRKPRLFLSHSSTDTAIAAQIEARFRTHFDVFLDAADIPGGAEWQTSIETAIADCHVAVVLLSKAVLERPFWVSNEAFVLAFRRRQFDPNLVIIPALLPGFATTDLETPSLKPAKLDALQAIAIDPAAVNLTALDEALQPIVREFQERSPYDWIERLVAAKLKDIDAHGVGLVADDLGLSRADLAMVRDSKRWLAGQLLRADLSQLEHGHQTLAQINRSLANDVFRIVAPYSWVRKDAADALARVANAPSPRKPVGMNAGRRETPHLYVRRASPKLPEWWTLDCDGDFGAAPATATVTPHVEQMVLDNIRQSLKTKLSFPPSEMPSDAELNDELDLRDDPQEPIFALLPPWFARMDGVLLERLRTVFPRIAFMLWTEQLEAALPQKFADLVLLPEFDPQDERRIYRVYGRCIPGEPFV